MQQDYYKEYYNLERQNWWFLAREKIISNFIQKLIIDKTLKNQDLKILNVGCGPGRSSEYLSSFGNVVSIEYDKECCDFAAEKTGLEIINGSITALPFEDDSFDLVCAFDVIEHVENDQLAVSEMKRVTKKNGLVYITVPAFMSLWSHHDVINHHFRRYQLYQIENLFSLKNDGTKIFTSYFNFLLFIPIYLARTALNILKSGKNRSGSGSDFETFNTGFVNDLLYKIMSFERKFINNKIKMPFGVSILYVWKKH